jgi:hypothetical protein
MRVGENRFDAQPSEASGSSRIGQFYFLEAASQCAARRKLSLCKQQSTQEQINQGGQ